MEKIKEITPGGLMDLCIELNSDDFHVWCDYSGHIEGLTIRVQPGGYKAGAESLYIRPQIDTTDVFYIYLDRLDDYNLDDIKNSLLKEYKTHQNKRLT